MNIQLASVTGLLYAAFQAHACYSLFFTVFMYHDTVEVAVGLLFGCYIFLTTFDTDTISESLADIVYVFQ